MKINLTYLFLLASVTSNAQLDIYNDTLTSKTGFIDSSGKIVIPSVFDGSFGFRNNIALCYNDSTYCLINTKGQQIAEFPFGYIEPSKSKNAYHLLNYDLGEFIFYDSLGKEKLKINYDSYDEWGMSYDHGVFVVKQNGKIGIISDEGTVYLPVEYETYGEYYSTFSWDGKLYFKDGAYFHLKKNGQHGIINMYGVVLIPFEYESIDDFAQDKNGNLIFAYVKKEGKQILLNSKLEKANVEFDTLINSFSHLDNGKLVLMNKNKLVLFDCAKNIKVDSFPAKITISGTTIEEKWGYDSLENYVMFYDTVPYRYTYTEKYLHFFYDGKSAVINNKGEYIFDPADVGFVSVLEFKGQCFFCVHNKEKDFYALFSPKGKQLTKYEYEDIDVSEKGFIGKKGGYDNPSGYLISTTGVIKKIY